MCTFRGKDLALNKLLGLPAFGLGQIIELFFSRDSHDNLRNKVERVENNCKEQNDVRSM